MDAGRPGCPRQRDFHRPGHSPGNPGAGVHGHPAADGKYRPHRHARRGQDHRGEENCTKVKPGICGLRREIRPGSRHEHPGVFSNIRRGSLPRLGDEGTRPGDPAVGAGDCHRRRLRGKAGKPGSSPAERHGGVAPPGFGGFAHRWPPGVPEPGDRGHLPGEKAPL